MNAGPQLARVLAALPHGEPFRFVSELSTLEPLVRGTGTWVVTGQEPFFAGHFPGDPIVPGVLLTEALAQVCGLVAFARVDESVPMSKPARLAQMDVKIRTAIRPPAQINLSATFVRELGNLLLFEVTAGVDGEVAADGRIVLAKVT